MADFYATTGAAQGTGDGSSEANRIELEKACENDAALHTALVAGSTIYVKDDGELAQDFSANSIVPAVTGTEAAPIRVVGYTTTITDGGLIDIRDTNAGGAGTGVFQSSSGTDFWQWFNIRITDPRDGWNAGGSDGHAWFNCHVIDAFDKGWDIGNDTGNSGLWRGCTAVGCGTGFGLGRRNPVCVDCIADGCGTGFSVGNASYFGAVIRCAAINCTGDGFELQPECYAVNCLAYGNGGDGFYVSAASSSAYFINCGSAANGAYGIQGTSSAPAVAVNCAFNPTNEANTSGKSNAITLFEIGEVTGDPLFADGVNDDFTLGASSAWKAAAAAIGGAVGTTTSSFLDLGPFQREEPAGGGNVFNVQTNTTVVTRPMTAVASGPQ